MRRKEQFSPGEGWVGSLPRALLWPVGLYLVFGILSGLQEPGAFVFAVLGAGVGLVIHFLSYLVIGLPLYTCFWNTSPDLWTWKIGLPTGAVLGAFALSAISMLDGGPPDSLSELFGACVFGGVYGFVTAAAAITSRRNNFK